MTSPNQEQVEALRSRAAEREQSRQRDEELPQPEPIAIVSMGCRFPGGVSSPEEFWELLTGDVTAI